MMTNETLPNADAGRLERGVRVQRTDFDLRREQWCHAVGVQRSNARSTAVLPWWPRWNNPAGFDHTGLYYWPGGRLHFFLTEPYHSTEKALLSLQALAKARRGAFSFVVGSTGTGLWLPGICIPLLVAAKGKDCELARFAAGLPAAVDFTQ